MPAPLAIAQDGFTSLFNGKDLTGWKVPAGDNGHWKVVDGVIDYDAESEAPGNDKALWSERDFGDFVLKVEWRIKSTPYINPGVPIILPSGLHKKDADGKEIRTSVPDSDSGIYLRGDSKAQVNIWGWPIGSGEVYGYRMDAKMPPGRPRRRDAEAERRPRHRRLEHVRDHDARRSPDGGPQRRGGDQRRAAARRRRRAGRSRCSITARRKAACGSARRAWCSSATSRSKRCSALRA